MMQPFDTRQLAAFQALARTGSFTAAARELNLTQSAISHSIKALEDFAGCALFARVGKKTHLTQSGEHLLVHARAIFQQMELAHETLNELNSWGHGRVRVSASTSACQHILPAVLREFRECFPQSSLVVEPGDSPDAYEMLENNEVDLAITLEPPAESRMRFTPLFSDQLLAVVAPSHPWARSGKIALDQINRYSVIVYNRSSVTFRLIRHYFRNEAADLTNIIEFGSMEAIKELVKIGLGVGILAPWCMKQEIADGSLVALPLGRKKLRRHWGVSRLKGKDPSLMEETFEGLCKAVCENL